MNSGLERAKMMRAHRRHDEAVAAIYEHLAQHPQDANGHLELALNRLKMPGERAQALEDINAAIAIEPDDPGLMTVKARVLSQLDRDKEALEVAGAAQAMAPGEAFTWLAKAEALGGLRRWAEAEEAVRMGLAIDPDSPGGSNLLAHFLRMQNKLDESEAESGRRLARDPENAFSFSNAGWSSLQRGDPKGAEESFREALRLDPELEHARLGLREAYKARSFLYRMHLKWCFYLQKHTEGRQWLIIIGIFLAFKFGQALLDAVHPLAAVPLILAYLLFAFGGWLASGLGNFLLLKDPLVRLSLNRREKLDGLSVGGLFFGGLLVLILGATVLPMSFAVLGGVMMGAAVPASMVFANSSAKGSMVFGAIALGILLCGVIAAIHPAAEGEDAILNARGQSMATLALIGVFATTWLGMIPSLRHAAER